MGWLPETKPSGEGLPTSTSLYGPMDGAGQVIEQATIGRSLVIKGEIRGVESLYIDGRVEGAILVPENRVTIGPHGNVVSDIEAHEIVVMGNLKGNILCGGRADIRAGCSVLGEIVARRISVEDGATIKGSVEVRKEEGQENSEHAVPSRTAGRPAAVKGDGGKKAEPAPAETAPAIAEMAAAKVAGSSVLLKEVK